MKTGRLIHQHTRSRFAIGLFLAGCFFATSARAVLPISGIMAAYDNVTNTNDNYSTPGAGTGAFPAGTTYDVTFNAGTQNNLTLTGFEIAGDPYYFVLLADAINLERVDNSTITGKHHVVLYEDLLVSGTNVDLKISYARTMEDSLRSSFVNRGSDNVFANTGDGNGNNNNVERIDYIFPDGFPVYNRVDKRGFLIMERGGNDRFKIAAITSLDTNDLPSSFNRSVSVVDTDWGNSGITLDTTVMRGYTENGQSQRPSANVGPQPLTGVFVTWQSLGLQTNDYIYGYSLVANDATTNSAYWTQTTNQTYFPRDTSTGADFGGLDLISGGMMFFEADLDVTVGDRVWDDWNGNGLQDAGEPGLSNVLVKVYDSNTNLAAIARTDSDGSWIAEGIGPGSFFAEFYLPTGYQFTVQSAGTDPAADSDADPVTGRTPLFAMNSGETNLTVDAGMHLDPGDLRLTKDVDVAEAKHGDTVVYTLGITNAGSETVALTQVTDVLPAAVAFDSYTATTGTYDEVTGIWELGELVTGAAGSVTITGTVNSGYGGDTITNTAAVTRMNRPDSHPADNEDSAEFTVQFADLSVVKTVDPASSQEGGGVDFTIELLNKGPADATGIEVTDLLPSGLSYDSSTASQGSYVSGTGIWTVGAVAHGDSASLVITATPQAGTGGLTLTNTATITASDVDDPVATNNTDFAELPVQGADLGIGKQVTPAAAAEGQTVVYTVSVTNFGPDAVTGVTVSEPLASGVTYASNTVSQGSYADGTGVWTVGALAVDEVAVLEIYATVDAATAGSVITNTSTITASSLPDPDPANDEDSASLPVSSLRLDKTSDAGASVTPGATLTYTMIVTNYGAVTHSNVTLTDAVPAGTIYVPGSVSVSRYPAVPAGSTTIVYTASSSFTAPAGVTNVTVSAWGGGGGGGQAEGNRSTGGGGAGGAYAESVLSVTPGSTYTVTVGSGGAGGSGGTLNGSAGGASWFDAVGVLYAEGGAGGSGTGSNNSDGAGATGSSSSSIGDTVYRGGSGSTGDYTANTGYSGAGGGGAGSTGAGGDASAGTGGSGTAVSGGDGADGVGNNSNGTVGSAAGGGGSGGKANNPADRDGGNGAAGRITVAYDLPPTQPDGTSGAPPNLASGWELTPGQWLEVTFQVEVDDPLALSGITNTASVTSDLQTVPLTDTVVDPYIPLDLGVGKAADAAWVSEGDVLKFTVTITNFSTDLSATGVEVTDLLPSGFDFVSATPGQGSYVSGTGVWTVGSLAPLAAASLEINTTAATGSGGLVWTNTATVSALDQIDTNPSNDEAQAEVSVRGADLAVIKTVNNATPNEGDTLVYTIVVTNRGISDTTGVELSEPLTNGLTFVTSSVSQGSYNSASGLWTVGDLDVGQAASLSLTATVDAGTMDSFITNISAVAASDQPDPVPGNNQDTAVVYISSLLVTKVSDVSGFVYPGSNITYTMTVSNLGAVTHNDLEVTDVVPAGTTYVPGSLAVTGPQWISSNVLDQFNTQTYTNNDGSMNWNGDWVESDPYDPGSGPGGGYVGVTGGRLYLDWAYVNEERVTRSADLSGYDSAVLRYDWETVNLTGGETVSVLVSASGSGPFTEVATHSGSATGSEEIDITSFMSANTTVRFENRSINWDNGDYSYFDNVEMEAELLVTNTVTGGSPPVLATNRTLQPGGVLTLTFDVTVDSPSSVTQIVNTVSVDSDQTATNVTATVTDPVVYTDLALTKTVNDMHPAEGDSVTYTITVTNNGPVSATGIEVSEPLTNGLSYVSDLPSQGTYNDASGIWTLGTLGVGSSATLTITADVDAGTAGTSILNRSRISQIDQSDPTPADNEDTASITVEAVDVGVGKSVTPAVPVEKELLVYTVSVTNFGPDTATGVEVTDLLPGGLTYESHTASQGTYNQGSGLWTIGTLTASQVETLSLTARVQTNTVGSSITNTATRTATDQVDTNAANDSASVVVDPDQAPLDIFKTVSPAGTVQSGDTLSYTLVVTNISNQTQTGVDVTDTLPSELTYVSNSISVTGPVTTNMTFLDRFSNRNYGNNAGTDLWTADWVESEGDGPASGTVQILFDTVRGATFTLSFSGAGQTLAREADLSGNTDATLSFDYRRAGLDAGEYVAVEVSSNGTSGAWTEIGRFSGAATDAAYSQFTYDISAWISSSTAIRFLSPSGQDTTDIVWIDDVEIETERRVQGSVSGSAPPTLISGLTLEPGEEAVFTFDVTVNTPVVVTQVVNSASVTSDQMTNPRTDTAVNAIDPDWGQLSGLIWLDENGDGIRAAGDTNRIANVPVLLMNTNGTTFASTTSDADGEYLFADIPPGTYFVRFDLNGVSTAVTVTQANAGGDPAVDSDVTSGDAGGNADTDNLVFTADENVQYIDLGIARLGSTRAAVVEVRGEWRNGDGYVVWETGSEWNTAGFFVYRVDPQSGDAEKMNPVLVPSALKAEGSVYELLDPQAVEGGTATVRLEELEMDSARRDLGTHQIQFDAPPPVALSAPAALAAPVALEEPAGMASEWPPDPSPVLKVMVRDEGMYGVGLQAVADGMGRPLEEVQTLVSNQLLSVVSEGCPVPFVFDEARGRIVFHGRGARNWYTRDEAYLISEGKGLSMTRRAPDGSAGATVFPVSVRFEEDRYAFDTALTLPDDFYYWEYIVSGNVTAGQRDFSLDLTGFAGGDVQLTVRLQGWSSSPLIPDHLADFYWNGNSNAIGSVFFDGQDVAEAELTIPAADVLNGTNTLTVKGVLQSNHVYSAFVVDRIDSSFDRNLVPLAGTAHFRAGGAASVSAAAFSEPLVFSVDEQGLATWIADGNGELPSKAWQTLVDDERFAVIDQETVPMLEPVPAPADAWFMSATNRIDYLIITSKELRSAAQELADYRSGQGLRVGVAVFEDICDLLMEGLRTPEAIWQLLDYANETWEQAPWMVVLAGNGHYDYLDSPDSNEANHLPPLLTDTRDGIFASDGLFTDLDEDSLPDIAIGRLPALTPAELTAMIRKIKDYETGFGSAEGNHLVFASDVYDADAGDFSSVSASLEALGGAAYSSEQIDLNTLPVSTARSQLLSRFDSGAGFVHYTGHGDPFRFSSKYLLKADDVNAMDPVDVPPVVVALSCLVGRYEAPNLDSLGELLMRRDGGGAVAVWGPSGESRNTPAAELGEAFYETVLQQGSGTLGPAVLEARRGLPDGLFSEDTFIIYNLLGDPALRIAGNTDERPQDDTFAKWRWQNLSPAELTGDPADVFPDYVSGTNGAPRLRLREGLLEWKQRRNSSDLEYHLLVSTNLVDWTPASPEILSAEPDAGGVMNQIRAGMDRSEKQLFMKLEVIQK